MISPAFGRTIIDAVALRSVDFNIGKSRTAAVTRPSRTATSTVRIRNGAGGLQLNGAFGGNVDPQVIEQLQFRIQKNILPAKPLSRKR